MGMLKNKYAVLFYFCCWFVSGPLLQAADPTGLINYQGRLLDKYGRRVNATVEIIFRMFNKDELIWQEKQNSVPVSDGLYSTILGSLTPLPASIFNGDEIYFEICINGETLSPRQRITASPYALSARTIRGPDVYVASNGNLGVGTTNPAEKLDVKGTVQATGFKMPTGASAGYVLVSDERGAGTWQALQGNTSGSVSNWAGLVFEPATNELWNAVRARVPSADYNIATGNLWTAIGQRVLSSDYSGSTSELWNAVRARLPLSGGVISGPVTNNAGFFGRFVGDGSGITNIPVSGFTDPGSVHTTGGVMTGPLTISNNLAVSGNMIWIPDVRTITADAVTTLPADKSYLQIGTTDGSLKRLGNPQIAPGSAGQSLVIQCLNNAVILTNSMTLALAEGVSFFMSTNDIIQLVYDGARWVETQRSDNN